MNSLKVNAICRAVRHAQASSSLLLHWGPWVSAAGGGVPGVYRPGCLARSGFLDARKRSGFGRVAVKGFGVAPFALHKQTQLEWISQKT